MTPKFFTDAAEFRRWLEANHNREPELILRIHKKSSGRGGLAYPEALEEALCFGWIDGVRRSGGDDSYLQRFSPRKSASNWSFVNIRHVERLTAAGRMHPAGLAAFAARSAARTGVYSFENRPQKFPRQFETVFRANKAGWAFWEKQPPGYQRTAIWWVISAKQEATRDRRLAQLIADSVAGRRIAALTSPSKKGNK